MGLINSAKLHRTLPWVDAYTMTLESAAEAKNNPDMRKALRDAVKQADAEALKLKTPEAVALAKQQRSIADQMQFSLEDHKEFMRIWKSASTILMSMDWDLLEPITFQEQGKGGQVRFWQGDNSDKRFCEMKRVEAAVTIKFLRFVEAHSPKWSDPKAQVKAMLVAQGITKANFHEHADRLLITNPWLGE